MENEVSSPKTVRIPILVAVNAEGEHNVTDYTEEGPYDFGDALDHVAGETDGVRAIYQLWLEVPLPELPQYMVKAPPLQQAPSMQLELKPLPNVEEGS